MLFTINLIGREQEAQAVVGREGFKGANQNTECIHDSQWEGYILFSVNLAYTCTNVYVHFTIYI